jgi:hypothetical protein
MTIRELASAVWENGADLPFVVSSGEPRPFSDSWFAKNHPHLACGKDSKVGHRLHGWYWIATDTPFEDLAGAFPELPNQERRPKGTEKYRAIADRVSESQRDLGKYISKAKVRGLRVVYNGHEGWVRGRLGGHYYTANVSTGALRISQHPSLHGANNWVARMFTEDMISLLPAKLRSTASKLVESKLGRTVVELEWRSRYGWPIFCRG